MCSSRIVLARNGEIHERSFVHEGTLRSYLDDEEWATFVERQRDARVGTKRVSGPGDFKTRVFG